MINQTVEKLLAMVLKVMADRFKAQLADPNMAGLSFEERFAAARQLRWPLGDNYDGR